VSQEVLSPGSLGFLQVAVVSPALQVAHIHLKQDNNVIEERNPASVEALFKK
jgi:hypothetical protein